MDKLATFWHLVYSAIDVNIDWNSAAVDAGIPWNSIHRANYH